MDQKQKDEKILKLKSQIKKLEDLMNYNPEEIIDESFVEQIEKDIKDLEIQDDILRRPSKTVEEIQSNIKYLKNNAKKETIYKKNIGYSLNRLDDSLKEAKDQKISELIDLGDEEYITQTKAENLQLYPTKDNPNPKHGALLDKIKQENDGYVDLELDDGLASGFIIDESSDYLYIMTNRHVIDPYKLKNIEFSENSGLKVKKQPIEYNQFLSDNYDIGIIKIPKNNLEINKNIYIPKIHPNLVQNKKPIITIGNSQGLKATAAFGDVINNIDKHHDKTINKRYNAIESKVLTYPGNSGGPILSFNITKNEKNELQISNLYLVGINRATDYQIDYKYPDYDNDIAKAEEEFLTNNKDEIKYNDKSYTLEEFKAVDNSLYLKTIGIDSEKYIVGHSEDIYTYSISSPDIIKEVNFMKERYPELQELKLNILQPNKNIDEPLSSEVSTDLQRD